MQDAAAISVLANTSGTGYSPRTKCRMAACWASMICIDPASWMAALSVILDRSPTTCHSRTTDRYTPVSTSRLVEPVSVCTRLGSHLVMNDFVMDIAAIQDRARRQVADGPITDAYGADRARVIQVLNEALATELVCVLRYKAHHYRASGLAATAVAAEFLEHAEEEQGHADSIAERIIQLQGEPNLDPSGLSTRSHSQYGNSSSLYEMLTDDLVAERIAIEVYTEIVRWLGDTDPTTRRMMEDILAVEEEHADDLFTLLGAHETPPTP